VALNVFDHRCFLYVASVFILCFKFVLFKFVQSFVFVRVSHEHLLSVRQAGVQIVLAESWPRYADLIRALLILRKYPLLQ
jgi:hypothetical protein